MVSNFEQENSSLPMNSKVLNREFILQQTLGSGYCSKVKLGFSLSKQTRVAIKIHTSLTEDQTTSL